MLYLLYGCLAYFTTFTYFTHFIEAPDLPYELSRMRSLSYTPVPSVLFFLYWMPQCVLSLFYLRYFTLELSSMRSLISTAFFAASVSANSTVATPCIEAVQALLRLHYGSSGSILLRLS